MGALDAYEIVEEKQIWRLFSCIWLHGGVFHVLSNMLGLVLIGIRLEQDYGSGMGQILSTHHHFISQFKDSAQFDLACLKL